MRLFFLNPDSLKLSKQDFLYVPCYCEENVYQLLKSSPLKDFASYAIFISNPSKTCALWNQKAASEPGQPAVWDYHVIPAIFREDTWWVYDLDSFLEFPCSLENYLRESFPLQGQLPESFEPRFKLVPKQYYLQTFASDRSHMNRGGKWIAEPPVWLPIEAVDERMNLFRFVDMSSQQDGQVLDFLSFFRWAENASLASDGTR